VDRHFFGSAETERKLRCLSEYLSAFTIALRNQNFTCIYIDAFAGSGSRTEVHAAIPLFGEDEAAEVTTPGSAAIAIGTDPPLDALVLIEQDPQRFAALKELQRVHDDRRIVIRQGDANEYVRKLCGNMKWRAPRTDRRGVRGVIFLDPYGMEVEWKTVEAIAKTKALDCWYFFPLSGLYRNAPHNPRKLDEHKQRALDRVLGATDWREKWYERAPQRLGLFETQEQAVRRADVDAIEAYVKGRLETAFTGTVLDPVRLRHRNGAPLASLFFAVSNDSPQAVGLATKIASHILNSGRSSHRRSR
jgi:three-Cys-motif partner protein